ncbi:primosomal protein N' [Nocardioides immobilis]|uniref:Probable replication restart protein PriA n=1 Tax=Nocardioides immobilis TaxID=2049295 RepID=A0A417XV41_9ACTN|nr:primosomal protein N' [Nocardioides immobilis]RHW24364.1 primosomal protein N' [Nocardioides immobilis]
MTADEQDAALPGLARAAARRSGAAARARRAKQATPVELAEVDPVARVLVDLPLTHLDRPFDYAVPAAMADQARPGVRIKVRFAGQDVDGYVIARAAATDHDGRLAPLRRVVSDEQVLTPAVAELCRRIAERYAGASSDVRRLAVPPRHATTEKEPASPEPPFEDRPVGDGQNAWAAYTAAPAFRRHLMTGASPRAVWSAAPGEDWPRRLAELASATRVNGRGVLICVPDHRDVARVGAALTEVMGPDHHVTLQADAGPGPRYRDFLMVSRGTRKIVVGTRSAAFAPVHDLGLVVLWDDGDDLHAEPRAPYPHSREVLLERAEIEGCAVLVGGFSRSVEADQLLQTGWAKEIAAPRPTVRERALIAVTGGDSKRDPHGGGARVPKEAHDAVRWGLERGPVLVQTPRAGYVLRLSCDRCRTPARCTACSGPLQLTGPTTPPRCRWCATEAPGWACAECGGRGLRAPVIGDARTADELGRAFAPVPVVTSSGDRIRATVDAERRIVVATPGAEPVAEEGYAVVVLLDTWLLLARDSMRAAEESLRRWSNAVALLRPGGRALAVGDPGEPALQALVRWDQPGFAGREAEERREARLPPATRVAVLRAAPGALDDALTLLALPEHGDVLGPLAPLPGAADDEERAVVRVPRAEGAALSAALGELQRVRSARKLDPVRIQVDPTEI